MSETTVEHAKAVIDAIRKSRHADDPGGAENDENSQDLARAIVMLSKELYSGPMHFVQELVQNADDNDYPEDVNPTLTFAYREDGYLWVGCNEIGFTEANVQAICRISKSTKSNTGSRKGFIGEKGIGFKSVFSVADIVWISSGAFTFKFCKHDFLGMLTPIWCQFMNTETLSAKTMFCLHIPNILDRQMVQDDLAKLDSQLLLFLRKLRKIEVLRITIDDVVDSRSEIRRREYQYKSVQGTQLTAQSFGPSASNIRHYFLTFTTTSSDMPSEEKRTGITESDIIIALPVQASLRKPQQKSQKLYAFLPVRMYGLSFLVNADFLLNAAREDVRDNNQWNMRLVSDTRKAFIEVIKSINAEGILTFEWPKYLHSYGTTQSSILGPFLDNLCNDLRHETVLQAQDGTFQKPAVLRTVPEHFMDLGIPSRPLVYKDLAAYVSTEYSTASLAPLKVQSLSADEFVKSLATLNSWMLSVRSSTWHSRLAKAMLVIGCHKVRHLPLIPLRTGEWVPAEGRHIFLPDAVDGLDIPDDIHTSIIDTKAASDDSRRAMFKELGARKLTAEELCNSILEHHQRIPSSRIDSRTANVLISHAWYLFKHGRTDIVYGDIKVATKSTGKCAKGSMVFMDAPEGRFTLSDYVPTDGSVCQFIHPAYLSRGSDHERPRWLRWLETALQVRTLPPLQGSPGSFDPVFDHIIDHHHSKIWLDLLTTHWTKYFPVLRSDSRLKEEVKSHCVYLLGEGIQLLEDTYLPTSVILSEPLSAKYMDLVVVDNPDEKRWERLATLGVGIRPDVWFWVTILKNIAKVNDASDANLSNLCRLYQRILNQFDEDANKVRGLFKDERLIGVPSKSGVIHWYAPDECRWTAPRCLLKVIQLATHYSPASLGSFFVDKLKVKNAQRHDALTEVAALSSSLEDFMRSQQLLLELAKRCDALKKDENSLSRLRSIKAFPVRKSDALYRLASLNDLWYIADRSRHRKCFQGHLWLLDFQDGQLDKVQSVVDCLTKSNRRLGANFKEELVATGARSFQNVFTLNLQSKAKYISLLVKSNERTQAAKELSHVQVCTVEAVKLRRYVIEGGRTVYGEDDTGWAVMEERNDNINILINGNNPAWHFIADGMARHFDLDDNKKALLISILNTTDQRQIEDILERAGLLSDISAHSDDNPASEHAGRGQEANDDNIGDVAGDTTEYPIEESVESSTEDSDGSPVRYATRRKGSSVRGAFAIHRSEDTSSDNDHAGSIASVSDRARVFSSLQTRQSMNTLPVINVANIVEAARRLTKDDMDVSTADPADPASGTPDARPLSSGSRPLTLSQSPYTPRGGNTQTRRFDMSDMRRALEGTPKSSVHSASPGPGNGVEMEIGYGGELFVYNLLKNNFGASQRCWTSNMRSRAGLTPMRGREGDYSDFTIGDNVNDAARLKAWLNERGCEVPASTKWYHIEVKATPGQCSEPFMMSNNQFNLARQWHHDPDHLYIVFRVFDLTTSPQVHAYLDPFAMHLANKLSFIAQGGFFVQPT